MRRRLVTLALSVGMATSSLAEVDIHGFAEYGVGVRTATDPHFSGTSDFTLNEARAQLQLGHVGDSGELFVRADMVQDGVLTDTAELELREVYLRTTPIDAVELKLGRQALTWGTGDLLFVNDLFAKDFVSFFSGRDDEYLKAPSDAVRVGVFGLPAEVELVWVPTFTPDRLPTGERFSVEAPASVTSPPELPSSTLDNGEFAARVYGYAGSTSWALYGYRGFWPTPAALRNEGTTPAHPDLTAGGASLRGALGSLVLNGEVAVYASDDGLSQWRGLVGAQRQVFSETTIGAQVYGERVDSPAAGVDEWRQVFTVRIEQFFNYQTVRVSLFGFGSPSDEDLFLRGRVGYKISDEIELLAGGNLFAVDLAARHSDDLTRPTTYTCGLATGFSVCSGARPLHHSTS